MARYKKTVNNKKNAIVKTLKQETAQLTFKIKVQGIFVADPPLMVFVTYLLLNNNF